MKKMGFPAQVAGVRKDGAGKDGGCRTAFASRLGCGDLEWMVPD